DNPNYMKDTKGFEQVGDGFEIGYYELEYLSPMDEGYYDYLVEELGEDEDKYADLLEFNVRYALKIGKDTTNEEVKEIIESIDVNGNTGTRWFELLERGEEINFLEDTILKVRVPVKMKDILGEKHDLDTLD